ncbi:hypothetical protein FisN_32Lh029 [Fistulifera solaris]|uniref:Uncharacterized protein n=1 Tax=Fistulifera solaris TaxID=1519565 RepID=A0A1Z5KPL8_FISSO|nr:hypothetical protein FisN_32Lh029 [Fistulifera solaris]|eukprot:GAX27951.1 hypothetical protein FisN_32Lh029 [Fistulifera solaris]
MFSQQRLYRRLLSSQAKRAASDPELQLMAGYLEHLDSLMESTRNIERSMEKLHETYAHKKTAIQRPTIQWTDTSEIDRLFDQSQQHKDDIAAELEKMKRFLIDARTIFAVEAPDGISDAMEKEDMKQAAHIIDEAAIYEDKEEIDAQHRTFAVDAPDGNTDGEIEAELREVREIIERGATSNMPPEVVGMKERIEEALKRNPET